MIRLAVAAMVLLSTLAYGQQTVESKDLDIGGLLKKPCDEDKKKPETSPAPQPTPTTQAKVEAIPGLLPADKQPAEPAKKSLGALPGAMENCK